MLAIGPVLLVNFGLKEHWGRARPADVVQFGGSELFTPYYQPTDQCASDCSFVSGHSSRGFYFVALAFLLQGWASRWRVPMQVLLVAYACQAAITRVVVGQHYASDVLGAAILISYIAWVGYRLLRHVEAKS